MKKILTLLICISLIFALSASVVFADFYVVDSFTGEVLSGQYDDESEMEDVGLVSVSEYCSYDKSREEYVVISSDYSLYTNVCDGQYTRDEVWISADSDAGFVLYYGDSKTEISGDLYLDDSGYYTIRDRKDKLVMEFTIVPAVTADIYSYDVPSVYRISGLELDGENAWFGTSSVQFEEEGSYEVSLYNKITGKTEGLSFKVDRTAPELEITGLTDGEAWNAVSLGDTEEDSSIEVYRDDILIDLEEEYKTAGDYRVIYTDAAGNSNEYNFTIHVFLDVSGWFAVILIAALIASAVAYMLYWRKHTRVG